MDLFRITFLTKYCIIHQVIFRISVISYKRFFHIFENIRQFAKRRFLPNYVHHFEETIHNSALFSEICKLELENILLFLCAKKQQHEEGGQGKIDALELRSSYHAPNTRFVIIFCKHPLLLPYTKVCRASLFLLKVLHLFVHDTCCR